MKCKAKLFIYSIIISISLVSLFSCKMNAKRSSFTGMLDEVDALIENGQTASAISELKKAEKYTYDSWSRIGIYRRYYELGEINLAEKVIKNGLKKNKKNPEMSAIYANLLMKTNREEEALKVSECLIGTRFGSVHSEAYLKQLSKNKTLNSNSYMQEDFFQVFYDAYTGSQKLYWLRNAALIHLKEGNYNNLFEIQPVDCTEVEDALFWALVMFDAKRFTDAALYAEMAQDLYIKSNIKNNILPIEIAAILSDTYVLLSQTEDAERARRAIISQVDNNVALLNTNDKTINKILPAIYVDSALYAETNEDYIEAVRLLSNVVDKWGYYVPGLIAYSDFAYRSSLLPEEDLQEKTLRANGMATLKMEKYDAIRKIKIDDALKRMDELLNKENNPQLYIARLNLKYDTDKTSTLNEKIGGIWNELEKSSKGTNEYPPEIFEFAMNKLLSYQQVKDAENLFRRYISKKYKYEPNSDFWKNTVSQVKNMTIREAEYAAWFSANNKLAEKAIKLYEYCVYESAGKKNKSNNVSSLVSTPTCVNLATVYSSLSQKQEALNLYSLAMARSVDNMQKAEIQYRMALIYQSQGKKAEALRSLGYALSLNKSHPNAKLLRDKLSY